VAEIIKDLTQAAEEEKAERSGVPKAKWEFLIVLNDPEGKIKDDKTLTAAKPYFYVLELKQGTAKKYGIKPGTVFQIPSNIKANY
jgi:hypothetical protein